MNAQQAEKPLSTPENAIWKALADPTRRRILDELRAQPKTTGALAVGFEMTRFGVMKHLRVLQEAGLVLVEARGRERWNHVNPAPIRGIYQRWIQPFEEPLADQALALKALVEGDFQRKPSPANKKRALPMSERITDLCAANILVEVPIEAPREQVFEAFVDRIAEWWHKDFYTRPGAGAFRIERKVGGLMFEDWGAGEGQVWGTVIGLKAPEYVQFVGDTDKNWGGPSRGIMTINLEEEGGTTLLRFEHSNFGHIQEKTHASLEEGWVLLLRDCLKPFVEGQEG